MSDDTADADSNRLLDEARRMHANYLEEDRFLRGALFEAEHRLDGAMLLVSTSALGFTVAIAEYAGYQTVTWSAMWWVWWVLGGSVAATILSMKASARHFRYELKKEKYENETKIGALLEGSSYNNPYDPGEPPHKTENWFDRNSKSITKTCNWIAVVLFFAGGVLFVVTITGTP